MDIVNQLGSKYAVMKDTRGRDLYHIRTEISSKIRMSLWALMKGRNYAAESTFESIRGSPKQKAFLRSRCGSGN